MMGVFEEVCKTKHPDHIHPADKKYTESLEKRQIISQGKAGFVKPLFFHAAMARLCSFTIVSLQDAIMTGREVMAIMDSLASITLASLASLTLSSTKLTPPELI